MTSQQLGDAMLAEHRAVMAAHYRDCLNRPTQEQYEAKLDLLREEMGRCVIFTSDLPSHLSGAL